MLDDLKLMLGIKDSSQDDLLELVINNVTQRLCILIGEKELPSELEYIVSEVSVIRFNRIGSEGYASHSVEGESMSWSDDDFAGYANEIQAYINESDTNKTGKVKFI